MRYHAKTNDGRLVGEGRTIKTAVNRARKRDGDYVVDSATGVIQWRKPDPLKTALFGNGAELHMTAEEARGAYHPGQCDDDVRSLAARPHIARQLDAIGHARMVEELKGYGCWTAEELSDITDTRERFVWLAAADIVDNPHDA